MIDNVRLLLVDTDHGGYDWLALLLSNTNGLKAGKILDWAATFEQAQSALETTKYDLCLLNLSLGEKKGLDLLRWADDEQIDVPFLLLTDEADQERDSRILVIVEGHLHKQEITPSLLERSIFYTLKHHRAKRQILESEARFRSLVETSTDAVVQLTPQGEILYASPSAFHLVGLPTGPPQDLFNSLHPEDQLGIQELLLSLPSHEGQKVTAQFRLRHQDGRWLWMEGTLTRVLRMPHHKALAFTYRDITERKQVEERLDRVLTNAHCILWGAEVTERMMDGGKWFEWSRLTIEGDAAQKVLPLDLAEGQTYAEAWFLARHPEDIGPMDDRCHRAFLLDQPHYVQEFRCKDRHGEWRWLQEHVANEPLGEGGWRAVGVCMDITELKRLEGTLKERTDALEAADHQKDIFLAMLAHELRNPLAPILNAVQIARRRGNDDPVLERLRDMVDRQVHHMARLLDDLLDVSRMTQGKIELKEEILDLGSVVEYALQAVQPIVDASGHHLTLFMEADPLLIKGDSMRLEQVVVNLLTNAAKYTEMGGKITVIVGHEGEEAVVRVKDDGIGIAPELLPGVFDLFTQVDASLDRSQGGLGIGLTLVKYLVARHGGSVTAKSEGSGKGSEFEFRLPRLAVSRENKEKATDDRPPAMPPKDLRILLVDDNVDATETLAELLRMALTSAPRAINCSSSSSSPWSAAR